MKKILIVDNYPFGDDVRERHKRFKEILKDFDVKTIGFDKINWNKLDDYSGFILSGSNLTIRSSKNLKRYEGEIGFVRSTEKPVLGICFGQQLIGVAFGFKVCRMKNSYSEEDKIIILKIKRFELCEKGDIMVEENHHEEIEYSLDFDRVFEILASTKECKIQAIRHKTKRIFGLQFHPETSPDSKIKEDGEAILRKFAELVTK